MDFTINTYRSLLEALQRRDYTFLPFEEFINGNNSQADSGLKSGLTVIMRHDIDRLPPNALLISKLESEMGIIGTYFFRIVPDSYDENIIRQIAEMGHEIGYHYEDVDIAHRQFKIQIARPELVSGSKFKMNEEEIIDAAWESFQRNLKKIRNVVDVKTICMHGSPRSKYDNKIIWEKYNYRDLGIIGEPYFDIDFKEFAYFTDTGRRWNGNNVSVRDKVASKYNFNYKTTKDIIDNIDKLPDKLMFTVHPQRWARNPIPWIKELLLQNTKNIIKRIIIKTSSQTSQY